MKSVVNFSMSYDFIASFLFFGCFFFLFILYSLTSFRSAFDKTMTLNVLVFDLSPLFYCYNNNLTRYLLFDLSSK